MLLWNRVSSYFAKRDEPVFKDVEPENDEPAVLDFVEVAHVPNICIVCNRKIPYQYFIVEYKMCDCCQEISLGQDKLCYTRLKNSNVSYYSINLDKPRLVNCKQCVFSPYTLKWHCDVCDCDVQYRYWP